MWFYGVQFTNEIQVKFPNREIYKTKQRYEWGFLNPYPSITMLKDGNNKIQKKS